MKKAIVIFTDGFEEIETIAPIDILRRAGIDVVTLGLHDGTLTGAHGLIVHADSDLDSYRYSGGEDAFVLPGGTNNAIALSESAALRALITKAATDNKLIAAICASSAFVLGKSCNLLNNISYTCYPGCEQQVPSGIHKAGAPVVVDGNIITSIGPGHAISFSLSIVEYLLGKESSDTIASAMCL